MFQDTWCIMRSAICQNSNTNIGDTVRQLCLERHLGESFRNDLSNVAGVYFRAVRMAKQQLCSR